jgi:hypothetical protein
MIKSQSGGGQDKFGLLNRGKCEISLDLKKDSDRNFIL